MTFTKKWLLIAILLPVLSSCKFPWVSTQDNSLTQLVMSEQDFQKTVIESRKPTVVKFTADWCGACKRIQPLYEKVATEMKEKYTFVTANVDNIKAITLKYNIKGIPDFRFFKDGKEVILKKPLIGSALTKEDFATAFKEAFE